MIALSTAWYPRNDPSLVPTLEAIARMGFEGVEIGISGARFDLKKAKRFLAGTPLKVVSIHNVCSERKVEQENWRGDWLASPDEERRRTAVELTAETVANAEALGASAVVLHLGSLPIEAKWEKQKLLYRLGAGGEEAARELGVTVQDVLAERDGSAAACLDAASRSLEELLERPSPVRLGLEIRMGWHELPSLAELGVLLERFPTPRVGYWHDVGHAVLQEAMGIAGQYEWLRRHGKRTIGTHLHDVMDRVRDHYPPGLGQVDFEPLAELLPADAILVMEISANFIAEEIVLGKKRLEEMGFCD